MSYTVKRLVISNIGYIQENDWVEINYTVDGVSKQLKVYCRSILNKTSSDFLPPIGADEADAWGYIAYERLSNVLTFLDEDLDFEIKGFQGPISFVSQLTARGVNLVIDSYNSNNPDISFELKNIGVEDAVSDIEFEGEFNNKVRYRPKLDGMWASLNSDAPFKSYFTYSYLRNSTSTGLFSLFDVFKVNLFTHPKYTSDLFSYRQHNGNTILDFNYTGAPRYKVKYSLDNVIFLNVREFTLPIGKHTIYIKNQLNKVIEKEIEVFDFQGKTSEKPLHFISKINPICFTHKVEHDNETIFKTDENAMSCNGLNELNHKAVQLWQATDFIKTQVKTNFEKVTAIAFNKKRTINLKCNKVRDFTNIFDLRTVNIYKINNEYAGVYFKDGVILDPVNHTVIKNYKMYGVIPSIYKNNTWLEIIGKGYVKIIKTIFDSNLQAEVLIFKPDFTFNNGNTTIRYNYDVQPFDVWEFDTTCINFLNEEFRIQVIMEDDRFITENYLSEIQSVSGIQKDCVQLVYSDTDNSEFMYETGIINKLRLKIEKQTDISKSETEIHIADTRSVLMHSSYYEGKEFLFSPLTSEIAKTLELALLHESLFINGVRYVSNERPKKQQLGNTNIYEVTATLLKSSSAFQFGDVKKHVDADDVDIQTPNLIDSGNNNFITY